MGGQIPKLQVGVLKSFEADLVLYLTACALIWSSANSIRNAYNAVKRNWCILVPTSRPLAIIIEKLENGFATLKPPVVRTRADALITPSTCARVFAKTNNSIRSFTLSMLANCLAWILCMFTGIRSSSLLSKNNHTLSDTPLHLRHIYFCRGFNMDGNFTETINGATSEEQLRACLEDPSITAFEIRLPFHKTARTHTVMKSQKIILGKGLGLFAPLFWLKRYLTEALASMSFETLKTGPLLRTAGRSDAFLALYTWQDFWSKNAKRLDCAFSTPPTPHKLRRSLLSFAKECPDVNLKHVDHLAGHTLEKGSRKKDYTLSKSNSRSYLIPSALELTKTSTALAKAFIQLLPLAGKSTLKFYFASTLAQSPGLHPILLHC